MAITLRERGTLRGVALRVWLCALYAPVLSTASAQERTLWEPQQYTSQNGLPQNSVIDLALDTAGYLWLTTEGGLVRYDGQRFQEVPLPELKGSAQERLRELIPVVDGSLLVSNSAGDRFLVRGTKVDGAWPYQGDRDQYRGVIGGICSVRMHGWLTARTDTLRGRSLWWRSGTLRIRPSDTHHWTIAGTRWAVTYTDSTLTRAVPFDQPLTDPFHLEGVWYGLDKDLSVVRINATTGATHPVLISGMDPQALHTALLDHSLSQDIVDDHALIRHGDRVILLRAMASGDTMQAEELPLLLPTGCVINTMLWSERNRVLFVGTDTKGLFLFKQRAIRTRVCELAPGAINRAYYALHVMGGDSVLAFSNSYQTLFTTGACTNLSELGKQPLNYQMAFPLENGHLLVARHDRIIEFDPRTGYDSEVYRDTGNLVTALDSRGDSLWIGDSRGIGLLHQGAYRPVVMASSTAAFCWMGSALWAATCDGVLRIAPGGAVDTLPGINGVCVRAITPIDDLVFIGTYGQGAYVLVNGAPLHLPLDKQGFLTHVHTFVSDGLGHLWLSTNRGLFRVGLDDLRAWIRDPERHLYYAYYGKDDGILNPEFNGGCDPAHVVLADGRIIFPSLEGIVELEPSAVPDPVPDGPVQITDLTLDGSPLEITADLRFPPDHGELQMHLSIPYWGSPVNVQLEYRINGVHESWQSLGVNERELRFTRLPPGTYALEVRKLGAPDSEAPTRLRFEVLAPFYRQRWFLALAGLATALLFYLALRINEHRLRQRNLELEAAVRERTQEIERVNESLRRSVALKERLVSIISHDIVTPLRFIARVARSTTRVTDHAPELGGNLRDIALSSDKLHANASNLLSWIKHQEGRIELRPRHEALNPLVEEALDMVRELATSQGDAMVNEVPLDDVLRTDRDVLLIILQNIVSNAVNYTRNGEVRVSGAQVNDHYELTISDTGPGITPKAMAHVRDILAGRRGHKGTAHGDPEMQGLGYVIIGELTAMLGGTVEVGARPSGGAMITIKLPLRMEHTGTAEPTAP